jgi:hypothetical protein
MNTSTKYFKAPITPTSEDLYEAAHRTVMPSVLHDTERYANNRAEVSSGREDY